MKRMLRFEELGIFILFFLFSLQFSTAWWLFFVFLLVPDVGIFGYFINRRVGAQTYNLLHHRLIGALLIIMGMTQAWNWVAFAGTVLLAHTALDRMLGFGLKYSDSFDHTHLGWLNKSKNPG